MFEHIYNRPYLIGEHHKRICYALDRVVSGQCKRLIINISPRSGKTLLVSQMFIAYGFAINSGSKFLHLSYSGGLTQTNSIAVKDIINSEYFQALFEARIRFGSDTKSKWATEQGGELYATSTLGQITGFGAGHVDKEGEPYSFNGAIVIDDPLKPDDALSDNVREKINLRFETTIRNRVNSANTPIIVIMQRLHEHDLCGYLSEIEPEDWEVLSLPILYFDDNGVERSLWDFKFPVEEMHHLRDINSFVFETQYMQNPKPLEGLMYRPFKTYDTIPRRGKRKNYTDSADLGSDYLCSVCYVECIDACYVTDVLYTKKPMEYTEPATAAMLCKNDTEYAIIESNNGGRGYMRNVESLCREYGNKKTYFKGIVQTKNKSVRLFTHANEVNNIIIMPKDWEHRWPEFASHLKSFRKEGRNAHDDAEDCVTGIVEYFGSGTSSWSDEQLLRDLL